MLRMSLMKMIIFGELIFYSAANGDSNANEVRSLGISPILRAKNTGGSNTCGGLVDSMCNACPSGGPPEVCSEFREECADLFCWFCSRRIMTCTVDFATLEVVNKKQVEEAICAQFKAKHCGSQTLDCCPDYADPDPTSDGSKYDPAEAVADFVEDASFGDSFDSPVLPVTLDGPSSTACDECKLKLSGEIDLNACPFPSVADADSTPDNKAEGFSGVPGLPGKPAFKSLQERCLAFLKHAETVKASLEKELNKMLCPCLGYCDRGECYFKMMQEASLHFEDDLESNITTKARFKMPSFKIPRTSK